MSHDITTDLVTLRDYWRYAISRFNAAELSYGHGTHTAVDDAAFLVLDSLDLPIDTLDPFLDARLLATERRLLAERIEARVSGRTISGSVLAAVQDPALNKRLVEMGLEPTGHGPDKLADPTQAEPVVKRMIELAPNEPTNYFQLAKIYEDSGEYELAEETYLKGRDAKPNDPTVYLTIAGYYNRQGNFEKLVENLRKRMLFPVLCQDIANAAAFLAGPESDAITGQTLSVNGGLSTPG